MIPFAILFLVIAIEYMAQMNSVSKHHARTLRQSLFGDLNWLIQNDIY
jgi:hypothetical protein